MHTLRNNLRLNQHPFQRHYYSHEIQGTCPTCHAECFDTDNHGNLICKNCQKTEKLLRQSAKRRDNRKNENSGFKREVDLNSIVSYLKKQEQTNRPIEFYYRDDVKPRKIYDYFLDEKYIHVKSDQGYYIKFLIEKIKKV